MSITLSQTLTTQIDRTVEAALDRKFRPDPLIGAELSRTQSLLGSLQKRHGGIIHHAIVEAVGESRYHTVLPVNGFTVSAAADRMAESGARATCLRTDLPYSDEAAPGARRLRPDLITLDHRDGIVRGYEIKRGAGMVDAGKARQLERDLLCTRMLARSYAESLGYQVHGADAKAIFFYGQHRFPEELALVSADLDDHFGVPVTGLVSAATTYFQQRISAALPAVVKGAAA